jgi:hypothetical protein
MDCHSLSAPCRAALELQSCNQQKVLIGKDLPRATRAGVFRNADCSENDVYSQGFPARQNRVSKEKSGLTAQTTWEDNKERQRRKEKRKTKWKQKEDKEGGEPFSPLTTKLSSPR